MSYSQPDQASLTSYRKIAGFPAAALLLLASLLFLYQKSVNTLPPEFLGFRKLAWSRLDGFLNSAVSRGLPAGETAIAWDSSSSSAHTRIAVSEPFSLDATQFEIYLAGNLPRKLTRAPIIELLDEADQPLFKTPISFAEQALTQTAWSTFHLAAPPNLLKKTLKLRLRVKPTIAADAWLAMRNRLNLYDSTPWTLPPAPLSYPTTTEALLALGFILAFFLLLPVLKNLPSGLLFPLFFLLAIGLHLRTASYIYFDEWHVLEHFSRLGFPGVIHTHNEHFLPLFFTLYFLEAKCFGDHYLCYVFVSLLIHTVNALLLVSLLKKVGTGLRGAKRQHTDDAALFLGFFWLASALHAEALEWAFEQCLLLYQTALLVSFNAAWVWCLKGGKARLITAALGCLVAPLFFGNGFSAPLQIGCLILLGPLWPGAAPLVKIPRNEMLKKAFVLLGLAGLAAAAAGVMYLAHQDPAAAHREEVDYYETPLGVWNYVYVGSQYGALLRGLALFPLLQMEAAPKLFKLWHSSINNPVMFLSHVGLGVSILLLVLGIRLNAAESDGETAADKTPPARLWLLGELLMLSSLLLPAFGRWFLGAEQSLSLRYHYSTLVGLAVLLLPVAAGIIELLAKNEAPRFVVKLPVMLFLGYFFTAQLFVGRRFDYFTAKGFIHRTYVQQLKDWNSRLHQETGLINGNYEGAGTPLAGLFPLHADTITPGKHPDEIYRVLNWLDQKKYPLR